LTTSRSCAGTGDNIIDYVERGGYFGICGGCRYHEHLDELGVDRTAGGAWPRILPVRTSFEAKEVCGSQGVCLQRVP
jgi:hypothetical protein